MDITQLRRFVAVAEELHFPRAADALNIPLTTLRSSVTKLEDELGTDLFEPEAATTTLTKAGRALLATARLELAEQPIEEPKRQAPAGGKAKASKGKGRAPAVKGAPRVGKRRQGR